MTSNWSGLRRRSVWVAACCLFACCAGDWLCVVKTASAQQLSPDEQAAMLLASARRGYQEGNYQFAIDRFREFLTKFGGHKDAIAARYGLGISILESPNKDYNAAIEALNQPAGSIDIPDRAFALYYLATAHRAIGHQSLAQAIAKPQETQHRQTANQRFDQAAPQFALAATAFQSRVKEPPAEDVKQLPADLEWAARARCDQAEMLVQQGKYPEARAALLPVMHDKLLQKSASHKWALYYFGHASFMLKDYQTAGKALAQLAPFDDPALALQARYLLARTHHLAGESPEAAAQYEAVITGYDEQRKTAQQLLQNVEALKNRPAERTRLEALTRGGPAPDYVAKASFYWGILAYEAGKFGDAATRFTTFPQQYQQHPLAAEAQFRLGLCQAQMRQYADAMKNLQPFLEHGQLGDQALAWTARARIGTADIKNAQVYEQAVRTAIDELRRAAEKAGQLAAADPAAKVRRGDLLLDLADTQQIIKMYKEAAATYQQVLSENQVPDRAQETLQRQTAAYHMAGMFNESDEACRRFMQTYPRSTLLPAVLFRYAENAFLSASTAPGGNPLPRDQEQARLNEAMKRYQVVIDQYPEFAGAALARQGMGLSLYRLGRYEEAGAMLASIPEADRMDEAASVSYVLADCILRQVPSDSSDALAAARIVQDVNEAIKLLSTFIGSQPQSPFVPDAMLKLGNCHQRVAAIMVEPTERTASLTSARQTYDKLQQQFPNHPLIPAVTFERANCMMLGNDVNGANGELGKFQNDPFNKSTVAPLALVKYAILLRNQKKPADAANMLATYRTQQEAELLKDPVRREWVAALQYQHGLATKEAGKLPEARAILEEVGRQWAGRNEAVEAIWRAGQCRREEAQAKLDAARKVLDNPGAKPEEKAPAIALRDEGIKGLRDCAQYLQDSAAQVGQKVAGQSGHLYLLYEAAWANRQLAAFDIDAARQKLAQDALVKLQADVAKLVPQGQPAPALRAPEIPLSAVPLQPAEQKARDAYTTLIETAPEAPLAFDARLELAELVCQRDDFATAVQLLSDAAAAELTPDLMERVQLALGNCWLATDNLAEALASFEFITRNDKSPLLPEAVYRTGEVLVRQKDWPEAIGRLVLFRDQGPFQNVPGVSDRALLRLGQAYAETKQWDQSRQAYETLIGRFGQSPWVDEARYGMGWAQQNMSQLDQAVTQYTQVTTRTAGEIAARAQVQIGLCRLEQKKFAEAATALLATPMTYAYAEPNAMALCEAARAYQGNMQTEEAIKLLERVVADHPNSRWAEVARQRLAEWKPAAATAAK